MAQTRVSALCVGDERWSECGYVLDIEPTGSPDGLDVGCEKKRDQSGLKGSGVSNRKADRSVGKHHQSTGARLDLKCLLHKPLVMLSVRCM